MRKLASIQTILALDPIVNADSIERATVLGWQLVVKKGEFKVGDLAVYCEIDSILPEKPEFEFLRERKFRIKTVKMRGQISQGICFPISILPPNTEIVEGNDVTDILGIKKHEPYEEEQRLQAQGGKISYPEWMPHWLQYVLHRFPLFRNYFRIHSGNKTFPSCIPKTDETRVQVLQPLLDKYAGTKCYMTEKLDGSSITVYLINGKFGVCSRNMDLKKSPTNKYWKTVIDHNIESKFRSMAGKENIALQGELIGEGIQGNKYKLTGTDIYFFNLVWIRHFEYGNLGELQHACFIMGEKMAPILDYEYILENSISNIVEQSKGKSTIADIQREGIVIRPLDETEDSDLHCQLVKNRVSFKCVNPEFLLKYGE
jgi:hypothetical protein